MQRSGRLLALACLLPTMMGCAGSKVTQAGASSNADHPVRAIALAPSGGLLADAIGVELSNLGYQVFDTRQTSTLLMRLNMDELEVMRPENITTLRGRGIDAVLSVRAAGGRDDRPQSASARVNSTHTGRIITGVSWQNGWGGRAGSIADRVMRKDLADAAREIAEALTKVLPK